MRSFYIDVYEEDGKYGASIEERFRGRFGSMPETRFSLILSVYPEHSSKTSATDRALKDLTVYVDRTGGGEYEILSKRSL